MTGKLLNLNKLPRSRADEVLKTNKEQNEAELRGINLHVIKAIDTLKPKYHIWLNSNSWHLANG